MKNKYVVIIIIALGLICYINTLGNGFIWDDFYLIVINPAIKSLSSLGKIFVSELFPKFDYYRPLQALTYLLDYQFYKLNPFGFHLLNIITHIFNALLVFFIFKVMTKNLFISLVVAFLFVCSPFHTEAVAYISGRADLLLGFFILLAFLFYIREKYIFSLLFFILALLSKEQAMIFPLVLIIHDLCFKNEAGKKIKYYFLFITYDITYIILRLTLFNFSHKPLFYRKLYFSPEISLCQRFLTFFKSIVIYLKIMVLPVNLHMERKIDAAQSIFEPYLFISLLIFALFIYLAVKFKKRRNLILLGIFWFFVMLFPQSSFFFPLILAEHFLYLPSIGIFLILAVLLESIWQRKRLFISTLLGAWLAFYAFLTITYNFNWAEPVRFYKWTLKFSPSSYKIHYLLGIQYTDYGLFDLAVEEFRKAIEIDKNFQLSKVNLEYVEQVYEGKNSLLSFMHHNIGAILSQKGLFNEAGQEFKKAIEFSPESVEAYNDLGCLYLKQKEFAKAEDVLNQALRIRPGFAKAYYNLGVVYAQKNDLQKAVVFWKRALDINPDYALAKESLSTLKDAE